MSGPQQRTVDWLIAEVLAAEGLRRLFGVVGSGNFAVTTHLTALGVDYVAARHEAGATVMADVHARSTGQVTAVSVHQGCGYSNALTGIAEAAKSHTPLLVLAAETPAAQPGSNFAIDQEALARAVGAGVERVLGPATAAADTARAYRRARDERRPIVLNMPLDVQQRMLAADSPRTPPPHPLVSRPAAAPDAVDRLAGLLVQADRPVFVAGRGARAAAATLQQLARRTGAVLLTSAVARGLFEDDPWYADTMGGFGTPLSQQLVRDADLVVAWGASLNRWTTVDGTLLTGSTVVQVDDDPSAIGRHTPVDIGIVGDVGEVGASALALLGESEHPGYRTEDVATRLKAEGRWPELPYEDCGGQDTIDPRTLTIELDRRLPAKRVVATDAGNFSGWPAMFLTVPDADSYCLPLGFQCVGLGVAAGVGLALAQPDRTPIVGVGDGGFLMGIADLETAIRLDLGIVYIVYDDSAYGAEVHHFAGEGVDLSSVTFPPVDIAAIARGYGADAVAVRRVADLDAVAEWATGPRERPLVIHARIASVPAWMLEHAFAAESSH